MSDRTRGPGSNSYRLKEIPISMSIEEGKLTVESTTGPKSGSLELSVADTAARLELNGVGSDRATAKLTGPELANFRTMVDATLSTLTVEDDAPALGRDVLYSGYQSLDQMGDGFGVEVEAEALRTLGLLNEEGRIAGGARQVKCTVLGNGTVILNLAGDRTSEISL